MLWGVEALEKSVGPEQTAAGETADCSVAGEPSLPGQGLELG